VQKFLHTRKKNPKFPRIFSLFDPNIIIMSWKNSEFFSQQPFMSNSPPENIWGSPEIFSRLFTILAKKFFFFLMQKKRFFFSSKIPLKFHFFRQKKSKISGFFLECKSCHFALKLIPKVHKH
jgi:hypothetical protein